MTAEPDLDDDALLDLVQQRTLRYFWDFAHPACGLARAQQPPPRLRPGGRDDRRLRLRRDGDHRRRRPRLDRPRAGGRAPADHGPVPLPGRQLSRHPAAFPAWRHRQDDSVQPQGRRRRSGRDAFLLAGLLCARQYFDREAGQEKLLRTRIDRLWEEAEWRWHTRNRSDGLYWHWSPNHGWSMNALIRGWNECLLAYVMAASAPRYPIDPDVYHRGWATGRDFKNGREFYGIRLPLGPDYGGPLFFAHFSFLSLDPRGLEDRYADYWLQNVNHVLINRAHCIRNPHGFKGYGPDCWGLTSSDDHQGYNGHAPDRDQGVITPTAALASFPYTPEPSMQALRHFYHALGDRIWGEYGFVDAFSETNDWYASSYLAIDQGPIVVMIENYRTGLLWDLFMSCPEIENGLRRLGFASPHQKNVRIASVTL